MKKVFKYYKLFFLALIGVIIGFGFIEAYISYSNLDLMYLRNILGYQSADLEVHMPSINTERLFELKPNVSINYETGIHNLENKYNSRKVTINSLGFRDKERRISKDKETYRIIVLGSSNTYGASVDDSDTYPMKLQKIFDYKNPGKFEVWNAGISGYVLSQIVEYGNEIKKYSPDLIIIQDHNRGRRPFLLNSDALPFLINNSDLITENIPPIINSFYDVHYFLLKNFRSYRLFSIIVNIKRVDNSENKWKDSYIKGIFSIYSDKLSKDKLNKFILENNEKKILIFNSIDPEWCKIMEDYQNAKCLILDFEKMPPEYEEIHPPSYVYDWYAEELYTYINSEILKIE